MTCLECGCPMIREQYGRCQCDCEWCDPDL